MVGVQARRARKELTSLRDFWRGREVLSTSFRIDLKVIQMGFLSATLEDLGAAIDARVAHRITRIEGSILQPIDDTSAVVVIRARGGGPVHTLAVEGDHEVMSHAIEGILAARRAAGVSRPQV